MEYFVHLVLVFMESKHQCLEDEAEIGHQLCARLLLKYQHDINLVHSKHYQ